MADFRQELTSLLNKHSRENASNTPDFVLAQFLMGCLETFNNAVKAREKYHGGSEIINNPHDYDSSVGP